MVALHGRADQTYKQLNHDPSVCFNFQQLAVLCSCKGGPALRRPLPGLPQVPSKRRARSPPSPCCSYKTEACLRFGGVALAAACIWLAMKLLKLDTHIYTGERGAALLCSQSRGKKARVHRRGPAGGSCSCSCTLSPRHGRTKLSTLESCPPFVHPPSSLTLRRLPPCRGGPAVVGGCRGDGRGPRR